MHSSLCAAHWNCKRSQPAPSALFPACPGTPKGGRASSLSRRPSRGRRPSRRSESTIRFHPRRSGCSLTKQEEHQAVESTAPSPPESCVSGGIRYDKISRWGGVPKWLRERSAKPLFSGSNPLAASNLLPVSFSRTARPGPMANSDADRAENFPVVRDRPIVLMDVPGVPGRPMPAHRTATTRSQRRPRTGVELPVTRPDSHRVLKLELESGH